MKMCFLFLWLPLFSVAQLVHVEEKEIVYKGAVSLTGLPADELAERLPQSFYQAAKKSRVDVDPGTAASGLTGQGRLKMTMPFHKARILHFTYRFQPNSNGYTYRLDSVYLVEQRRGWDPDTIPAKKLVENMEETGTVAIETERILNEIDLRLQKILRLTANGVGKKASYRAATGRR